ncbi:ParB/RepB/Spo0J family partition protein [Candidatus Sumerlaeota bacterium]|nr:ParB/RepB/Spo0J family partition protein [Candidatus Sumerlaeota bacterium]
MSTNRKSALGKGLSVLMGARPVPVASPASHPASPAPSLPPVASGDQAGVQRVALGMIKPNPRQPRQTFKEEALHELRDSILNHGILQPVLLTKDKQEGGYFLVAGERRYRAAELAGLKEIPALISSFTEEEMLEVAIVENVQRDDLNPVEEAKAYRALADSFGWTHEQIAQRVGKNRTTVVNSLRLLKLGSDALKDVEDGLLTPGHARAILSIDDSFYRQRLRQDILDKGLSVRQAEKLAIAYQKGGPPTKSGLKKDNSKADERLDIVSLQDRLMEHLGCRIRIQTRDGNSGRIEIPFQNHDELERFFQAVNFEVT